MQCHPGGIRLPMHRHACRKGWLILEIIIIMEDIWNLKKEFKHCGFLLARREANEAAHVMVFLSLSGNLTFD